MLSSLTELLTQVLTELLTELLTEVLAEPLLSVLIFGLVAAAAAAVAAGAAADAAGAAGAAGDAAAAADAAAAGLGLAGAGLGLMGGLGGHARGSAAIQSRSNSSDTYHEASTASTRLRLRLDGAVVWWGCGGVGAGSRLVGLESDLVARPVVQVAVVEDAAHLVRAVRMRCACGAHAVRMRCACGARAVCNAVCVQSSKAAAHVLEHILAVFIAAEAELALNGAEVHGMLHDLRIVGKVVQHIVERLSKRCGSFHLQQLVHNTDVLLH